MKISVMGTGYVGLVSGVCLADKGHDLICVDIDADKVAMINRGEPPIYEKGLEELLKRNVGSRLTASTDLATAVHNTEVSLISVGTPFNGEEIDLTYIEQVARQIGEVLKSKDAYHLVVVKSTVVPGTTDDVVLPILEKASGKKAGRDFGVGMNPEFLREGEAVGDFMDPDRIVMGGMDERSVATLGEVYAVFDGVDKVGTNNKTAEMVKYTANSLLATMISFSNEVANLCTAIGDIDVTEVMSGVHLDKRLSPILDDGSRIKPSFNTYLEAGCGFGGSCFPKDVKALIAHGARHGSPMRILDSAIAVNRDQPRRMVELIRQHYPDLKGLKVAVLGLAFKPGTDDMRESPALPIVTDLVAAGARVTAYDPIARHEAEKMLGTKGIKYCDSVEESIDGVDAIALVTRWPEFQGLPKLLEGREPAPLLVDGRRMLDKGSVSRYEGIGLRGVHA